MILSWNRRSSKDFRFRKLKKIFFKEYYNHTHIHISLQQHLKKVCFGHVTPDKNKCQTTVTARYAAALADKNSQISAKTFPQNQESILLTC